MKKLMSVLLTVCMAMSLFAGLSVSAQAEGARHYHVYIAGEQFAQNNLTIGCGGGTAKITPPETEGGAYTLTLHNATISVDEEAATGEIPPAGIDSEVPLTIVLEGVNTITSAQGPAVVLCKSTTIREAQSGGFLFATADVQGMSGICLWGPENGDPTGKLTIESGYVSARGINETSGYGIISRNWSEIEVTGGTLIASGTNAVVVECEVIADTMEVLAGDNEESTEPWDTETGMDYYKYISISDTPRWRFDADISWYDDEETEFTLTTPRQLAGLAKLVNDGNIFSGRTITLGANIDLSGKLWTPIGYGNYFGGTYFSGTFNGNGKTISGLTVLDATAGTQTYGLFGRTEGAAIKNAVVGGSITVIVPAWYSGEGYLLGMVGFAKETHIENCRSSINISVGSAKSDMSFEVGGIAGRLEGYVDTPTTIVGCSNSGSITVTAKSGGFIYVGGLAGYLKNDRIYNSFNTGAVLAVRTNEPSEPSEPGGPSIPGECCVGGIAGKMERSSSTAPYIANCYNRGSVTATGDDVDNATVYGVVGKNDSGRIYNSYSYVNDDEEGEYWCETGCDGAGMTAAGIKAKLGDLNTWVKTPSITLVEVETKFAKWYTSSLNDGLPCFEKPAVILPPKAEPVIVDGTKYDIGTKTETTTTTTVKVDEEKLRQQVEGASDSVLVPITTQKNTATAQLMVKNVEDMAKKDMTLSVQTGGVTYQLPTTAVDTSSVMEELGAPDSAKVPVSVTITNLGQNAVTVENGKLMLQPVQFTVTATYGGKTVEMALFSQYVQRIIEIPEGTDASKITTALRVEDGKHVPTEVFQKDGKWYAKISSRTNSTYALIYNEESFDDAAGKWYEETVNEMASRCVVFGRDNGEFDGGAPITRAEFAAIVIRALGLPETEKAAFSDVTAADWFYGAVGAAGEYGLINGRGSGIFDPTANITREEAMAMIARAAKIAEYAGTIGALTGFSDAASVSAWAKDAASFNVGSGLIIGDNGALRPTDSITRAETATVVLRLLQKAELVDLRAKA